MQSEQRISLVPLTSLCSASSLSCSRSNDISTSTVGMGLDATEDLDNFYSRCLLCTCRPDVTPHIEIFSQAGNQLQLADKINKYLNIQIEAELPQNVCHSCIEQLNSTHELVMKSQKARIMLLQIKQQIENLGKEEMALDNLEPEDQSANDLAVHTIESTHETVCVSTSKPPSPSPEEHMDIENVFIKQELDVEEFENEDTDVTKEVCNNAESTVAPHGTLAVELAHCSQDLQTPLDSVCTMDTSLEEPQIKDEIETEEFTFPQLETDVDVPSRIQVSIPASSDLPLLANPDTSFTSAVTETTSMDPYTSLIDNSTKTEILCPVCHNLCFNENLLLKHCLSIHTVTYNSMGSISYQRPFRFIHCKVEKCMWKTKFLGVDRKELISQFKVHAQINHNNMFVCEYCLAMFENREQFCDHNTQYHPKHKCEFSSSDGVCDCSSTSKVSKGTICGVAGCKWSCVTTDEKQMLSKDISTGELLGSTSVKNEMDSEQVESQHAFQGDLLCHESELEGELSPVQQDDVETEETRKGATTRLTTSRKRKAFRKQAKPSTSAKIVPQDHGGPVKCELCNEQVKHKYSLIKHKNLAHNMNLTFDCEHCGKKYISLKNMSSHLRNMHTGRDHVCDLCGKAFTKEMYEVHKTQPGCHLRLRPPHEDMPLEPISCDVCNCALRNKYSLLYHMNTKHLDVLDKPLPYNCETCHKEIGTYKYLMHHVRNVHIPKPRCKICGKLVNRYRLAKHLEFHEIHRVYFEKEALEGTAHEKTQPFEEVLIPEIEGHAIKQEPEDLDLH